ncbi:MAG: transcriptional repressor [Chloroflexi bacterium]|nr:transcriptional repressor [Chloroflexota bacterium]MCL5076190.1 transcriptional repressor [Chloroflexota bacterium]
MKRYRNTKQKQCLLRVLRGTTTHPPAIWVYEQVRQEIPSISLGTVYRNLELLSREGQVQRLDTRHPESRYDANVKLHYHFVCLTCERVYDVPLPPHRELEAEAEQISGHKVGEHVLMFYGTCKDCLSTQGKDRTAQ